MKYVFWGEEIRRSSDQVGAKAVNLKRLQDWGFLVPNFACVPTDTVEYVLASNSVIQRDVLRCVVQEIILCLPCSSYAVRSSCVLEDGDTLSYAGQFLSVLDVHHDQLQMAIMQVLLHAQKYLQGVAGNMSLIVQEFIEADMSGVTFTKNPLGGQSMVVEYVDGGGEKLVSGKVTPRRLEFSPQHVPMSSLPDFGSAVRDFEKIQLLAGKAQDIEWCIKGGRWYFLQTRPITGV